MENPQEFITTLTGQLISWPVAAVLIVILLKGSIRSLLQRVSEAEGFGVKASFQELQEAVDQVELRAEIEAAECGSTNGRSLQGAKSNERGEGEVNAAGLRLRSALDEARLNPRVAVRTARGQLMQRVIMWERRINPRSDRGFYSALSVLERTNWISSDLKSAISTAASYGRRQSFLGRSVVEAQAISYLTLVARLERLLDEEVRPNWARMDPAEAAAAKAAAEKAAREKAAKK